MPVKVCVIGAGVIGVSSAVRVLDLCPGSEVTIVTDAISPNTTSDVAGGFWEPHLLGDTPIELIRKWSEATFKYMIDLAHSQLAKHVGASIVSGYQLWYNKEDHFWKDTVFGYRDLTEEEIRRYPGMRYGVFYTTAMLEPRLYLPWLMRRFEEKGGKFKRMFVKNLQELSSENYDVIINCTGVGAQALVGDNEVQPVRGQIIRVQAPWLKYFCICLGEKQGDLAYVLPGTSYVVMGGTEQRGNWDRITSSTDRKTIWEQCCKYLPSLKEAKVVGDRVGLRPSRTSVRLELEYMNLGNRRQAVVHNYGHGGGGVTLHWGCAENAAELVKQAIDNKKQSKL